MSANNALKILVLFYSRTGTTSKIAADLARRCGADLEEIREVRHRNGVLGYLRSAKEALRKTSVPIRDPVRNWSAYDVVVLGTPVWAGHIAAPMRAYLSQQSAPAKQAAFFCTMGGRGAEKVFAELSQLTQMSPVATLALTDAQISRRRFDELLNEFARKIVAKDYANKEASAVVSLAHAS